VGAGAERRKTEAASLLYLRPSPARAPGWETHLEQDWCGCVYLALKWSSVGDSRCLPSSDKLSQIRPNLSVGPIVQFLNDTRQAPTRSCLPGGLADSLQQCLLSGGLLLEILSHKFIVVR
jgi:hypothetical protein